MPDIESSVSIAIPGGVKDFLPEKAGRMRHIRDELARIFELWGYREVITPVFEYLDVISLAEPELLERMFKFEDRASGKVLALRPDMTAQVARLVASHLKDHPKPLRLHYNGSVLHYGERDMAARREVYQAGLELVGIDQAEADGEVIAVAIQALRAAGLREFKIDVGQVEFFRGVMEGLNLPDDLRRGVEDVVARKDRTGIEGMLDSLNLNGKDEETLLALPALFGDRAVLDRADSLMVGRRAKRALENLSEVLDTIGSYGLSDYITVDLGEIRGLNYYTGIIFEGFSPGMGEEICGGGRYDSLLGRYGYQIPATGFAVNVETLIKALDFQGVDGEPPSHGFLMVNRKRDKKDALRIARHLRSRGVRVARDILKRDIGQSIRFARSENIGRIILIGGEEISDDEFLVQDVESGKKISYKIEDLLEGKVEIAKG